MARKYDEDLFQETTMTFGEHLEELRICLFRALIGLVIGFGIGLWYGDRVVAFIQTPLEHALQQYYKQIQRDDAVSEIGTRAAEYKQPGDVPVGSWTEADVEQLVTNENLIFDEFYIEPREVMGALRDAYPQVMGGIEIPRNRPGHPLSITGPVGISSADLLKPVELARAIVAGGGSSQPGPGHRVWELFDERGRALVESIAKSGKVSDEERDTLARSLTRVLAQHGFFVPEQFAGVKLMPEAKLLVARFDVLKPLDVQRLNRLVFEESFGGNATDAAQMLVAPSYPDLIRLHLWRSIEDDPRLRASSFNPQEAFVIYIKAALVTGIVISSPWVFYQLWLFVAAGLYPHEKKYVHVFLPFSLGLFLAGAALAFFAVFQPVLEFLFSFNRSLGIDPEPRISEWMSFVLMLPLGFGISFQLPLVMLFLERIGIFSVRAYLEKWRIAVLVIFVLSAILTPADPYSMLLMAIPLTFLYFGGILVCYWFPRSTPQES
ncbi:MAG: twin-arginine translocase subunit TatC [Pirellulales bacterium]|nr:twin-arginine translocase subunit TatC [Pirellulales bacterium]